MSAEEIPNSHRIAIAKSDLAPCCLRIHPNDPSVLLVGTYDLNKETNIRVGSVELFKIYKDDLIKVSSYKTSGAILDMKFSPYDSNLLVSCHSTGNVILWNCEVMQTGSISLSILQDERLFANDLLITSIFFSPIQKDLILLTLTNGQSATAQITNSKVKTISHCQNFQSEHQLECWTGAFGSQPSFENVVFTGGDDAKLIANDLRTHDPIFTNSRLHDAGVVSILPSTKTYNSIGNFKESEPYSLYTGSYDDKLRSLDLRAMTMPIEKAKLDLGGGVWRLIPSPLEKDDRVLACCMYDGARILDLTDEQQVKVTRYFKKNHESICYGGDWSIDGNFVATCSFYDNVIQVWSPNSIE